MTTDTRQEDEQGTTTSPPTAMARGTKAGATMSDRKTDTTMAGLMNTDALRDLQALSGGILSRNLLPGSGVWKMNRDVTEALGAAADEVDRLRLELDEGDQSGAPVIEAMGEAIREITRLRAVIENAPHDSGCQFSFLPEDKPRRCTCWKTEAL